MAKHTGTVAADMLESLLAREVADAAHAVRHLKQAYAFEVNSETEWKSKEAADADAVVWDAADARLARILADIEAFEADCAEPHVALRRRLAEMEG